MAYRDDPPLAQSEGGWVAAVVSAVTGRSSARRNVIDFRTAWRPRCPEIDCVRAYLPWQVIAAAERRTEEIGLGADRVLIAEGTIDEDRYLAALATRLGTAYERLDLAPRDDCPLSDDRLIEAAVAGLLPLNIEGELIWVVAPRNLAARTVTNLITANPLLARRIRLTSTAQLNRFIARHGRHSLGLKADRALVEKWPELSAAPQRWRPSIAMIAAAVMFAAVFYAFPDETKTAVEAALALGFLAWLLLRLAGSFITPPRVRPVRIAERGLPIYTVIVALYREAAAVEGLVGALRELDYPPEKLDIKLVIEPDDRETRLALEQLELGPPFEIVVAPPVGPRTKPKALNAALAFARGTFTAVYDAEDRPDPDQLKRVLDVFLNTGDDVACVQASLTIDNTADGWLTRIFTAEYAAQFDLFLPGLAALELPLPLGGSSNHFRTATLQRITAWDPYNVTEDADLGVRLSRFGYRSAVARSTTYEEAPAKFGPWLRQRTRWFKGWMQTWCVHMRSPARLYADLGFAGFISFQLVVGGSVLAALIHPLVLAGFLYTYMSGLSFLGTGGAVTTVLAWLYGSAFGAGYCVSIVLGLRGLARRKLLWAGWALALLPIYWLLLSLAAWRAFYQLLRAPQRWEKTEHGLARTSRRAKLASKAALRATLERRLRRRAAE